MAPYVMYSKLNEEQFIDLMRRVFVDLDDEYDKVQKNRQKLSELDNFMF